MSYIPLDGRSAMPASVWLSNSRPGIAVPAYAAHGPPRACRAKVIFALNR